MELWFIFAIMSALALWIAHFLDKVIARKWFEKNNILFFSAIIQVIISFLYFLYIWSQFYMTFVFLFLIILRIIINTEKDLTKIESLKYLDTSLFFPINNIIKIWWWFLLWMLLFWEFLTSKEYIFLIWWIISTLFLWYKEFKNKDINFKKWIKFLIISSLLLLWAQSINKYMWKQYEPSFYVFLYSFVSFLYLFFKIKVSKNNFTLNKEELFYGLIRWLVLFIAFLTLVMSFKNWKLVIIQLISTISVFIPIILTYFIYKEKISRIRLFGLILFLLNLLYFFIEWL